MNIQKITLRTFFPAMYLCAFFALFAIWFGEQLDDSFFRIIPTFLVIGLASLITWIISVIIELKNIAKLRK